MVTNTLSQQIESELREAVCRGKNPAYPLTLNGMAKHFDVSIQPVRTAVETLLEERWILRNAQGRLALNPKQKGKKTTPPLPNQDIATQLEQIIIQHSLRGENLFLREEETAEQLGVGRTVLRGALTRLAGRGLLEHMPRRGWQVVTYDEARMLEYLDVREVLELKAIDLAKDHLEEDVLKRMLEGNTPDANGNTRLDDTLHAYWIERAGNAFITGFFKQYGAYHTALFRYAGSAGSFVPEMAASHCNILEALLERHYGEAKRLLRQHIRAQRPIMARLLELTAADAMESRPIISET